MINILLGKYEHRVYNKAMTDTTTYFSGEKVMSFLFI